MHAQKRNPKDGCQRSIEKIMAENCQGKITVVLLFPDNKACRGMSGLLQNNSMITCRAQHRAEIIPGTENNTA